MGLPHEDISRLQQQNSSFEQATRAEIQKLKEELSSTTRFFAERIGDVNDDIRKLQAELVGFLSTLSKFNSDRIAEIKSLQARVTKLEDKSIF
jgi:uncharacterized protein YPO0396